MVIALSFIQWPTWGGPTVEAVFEGDYRDFVLLVSYGIIIYSRLLASSSKVQVVERLVRLFTKERNPEVVDNLNKIFGMFCLNFCQVFKDLNPRTSFNNISVWNAWATLLFKHIHVYITSDLYNLNFIALDKKLTELDKLISKFWNNCQ